MPPSAKEGRSASVHVDMRKKKKKKHITGFIVLSKLCGTLTAAWKIAATLTRNFQSDHSTLGHQAGKTQHANSVPLALQHMLLVNGASVSECKCPSMSSISSRHVRAKPRRIPAETISEVSCSRRVFISRHNSLHLLHWANLSQECKTSSATLSYVSHSTTNSDADLTILLLLTGKTTERARQTRLHCGECSWATDTSHAGDGQHTVDTGTTTRSRTGWVDESAIPKWPQAEEETERNGSKRITACWNTSGALSDQRERAHKTTPCSLLAPSWRDIHMCGYVSNEISVIVPLRVAGVQQLIPSSELQSLSHHHLDEFLAHSYVPHRWSITMLHLMRRRPRENSDAQIQQCNGFGTHLWRRFPRN